MPVQVRHILCPIDFSEGSRHALDHSVALARGYNARLSVVHVTQIVMPVYGVSQLGPEGLQAIALTELERRELLGRVDAEVAEHRRATGLSIEAILDEASNVPDAIASRARTTAVDVIVIGTHGRSGFERLMLGSVAEKVLRKAPCPVLTVPPRAPDAVPREAGVLHRIVCPTDFSRSAERALQYAVNLARDTRARLTALHVVEPLTDLPEYPEAVDLTEIRDELVNRARTELSRTVKATAGNSSVDELVLVGRSHAAILRVAADQSADLIVMGVRGRGPADLLFFGSTANHVIRGAHCPVLTVRDETTP